MTTTTGLQAEKIDENTHATGDKIMLLDGHSLAFRAFYALPAEKFTIASGQHTNAVYGFLNMVLSLIGSEKPSHIACVFDEAGPTFRTETYAGYKAHRPPTPPEFSGQIDIIRQFMKALGIVTLSNPDYEADDLIATIATQANKQGFTVNVVSGDRDSFQLINENITVLFPLRGTSELKHYTIDELYAKYELTPGQYLDFAALRGDPSDNLPSVPKVGEKTAQKLISRYGSLSAMWDHIDEITGVVGQSLRNHREQVDLNRHLTQLVRTVPVPLSVAELRKGDPATSELLELCDAMEFKTLRNKINSTFKTTIGEFVPEEKEAYDVSPARVPEGALAAWLKDVTAAVAQEHTRAAIDVNIHVVATHPVTQSSANSIAIAGPESLARSWGGCASFHDVSALSPEDSTALAEWLRNPDIPKTMFAAKTAAHALRAAGYELRGIAMDVELAAYVISSAAKNTLTDLVDTYLDRSLSREPEQLSLDISSDSATEFHSRAVAIRDLTPILERALAKINAKDLIETIELPVQRALIDMEAAGIAVDNSYFRHLQDQFNDLADASAEAAWSEIGGQRVNLNSPKQLQVVLFETLQMPKTKKIKTGYTTDAEALTMLYGKTQHPFLHHLLEYRDAQRLRTTVDGLIRAVETDSRIHTTFNQAIAATGRLSSQDPNMQNIPIRTPAGRMIRSAFVVGKGYESLLTADYSQIEMRIMAHLSQDQRLIAAFNSGEDLHKYVGSVAFGVPIDAVTSDMRRIVKTMSYGLSYGLQAHSLARQLKISTAEANDLMNTYFERFGGVRDYLHDVVEQAKLTGYTETIYGRRRYFPELNSSNKLVRNNAERAALNAPIQGSAADIIKVAMVNVARSFAENKLSSRMLLQVHDELVIEVAPGEKQQVTEVVTTEMGNVTKLDVPLEVSTGFGPSWNEAEHS